MSARSAKWARSYPTVKRDYAHVDATCMWFVKNPEWFDVIVTDNMFGDIITDLAAMIQGGLGVAAGGNINPEGTSMFEPMGGSAPKYTGLNVINPIAAINAAGHDAGFPRRSESRGRHRKRRRQDHQHEDQIPRRRARWATARARWAI